MGLINRDVPITNPIKKNINQHSNSNTDKTIAGEDNTNKEHLESQKGKKPLGEIVTQVPEIRKKLLF